MGLSLSTREVQVLVSFRDYNLVPRNIPDRPAQELVDKVLKEIKQETGVQVIPRIYPVDCRRLPIILRGRKLKATGWYHQVRRDDIDTKAVYHSVVIVLAAEGDEVLTAQVLGWLDFFLGKQAMKVRGYDNPHYFNDERTGERSSSLNLDYVKDACCPEEGRFCLEWTSALGLRFAKKE